MQKVPQKEKIIVDICWRCLKPLQLHPTTYNCFYCGYSQDIDHVEDVKAKKAVHDFLERNPQSYGSDKNYPLRKKWSMRD